ncbi:KN motif and ankyrin repeat domain-containing protein 4-like [Astyanax mexicanus]|uniref:KN motif and ankyrin repeat domain-containing protein 4-like n=2 Tax=Astyanax mexicanus TaxID=7994 RepID=A0A8T2LV26_ASTMX|nr:KN motif and ankyrin repeat domain-containing protein 4-like [Astyanax mexicanus]
MDAQKVNGVAPKENGHGSRGRPPCYSVETPYGFHLDLDFLKYVDDIEKGNTIRRVPIQRRQRGRTTGSLSRNLSLPGYGCSRPSQWNSTGILFPRPRLADLQQSYGNTAFQSSDGGSTALVRQVEPSYSSFTAAEMDATIQAFDEQPLGLHVRPNLLRASSLPLTVLLRKRSESIEDPTSPNGSRDYLTQENGSSEDVFHSPERKTAGANGTLQRLTAALQRTAELEEEIRVIPELKAQICILQEEREMLLYKFQTQISPSTKEPVDFSSGSPQSSSHFTSSAVVSKTAEIQNKANDDWMNREYDQLEENVKASSEQVDAIVIPFTTGTGRNLQGTKTSRDNKDLSDHGDRSKSLTETLQRKVVTLEQKLHELESDLDKTRDQLKQQVLESRIKDERIKELNKNVERNSAENVWVRAEGTEEHSPENKTSEHAKVRKPEASVQVQESGQCGLEEGLKPHHASKAPAKSHTEMEHHVKRVKELLHEQWECLCRKESSGRVLSSEHLPPRVCSIQEQLVTLVSLLSLYVSPAGELQAQQPAQTSKLEDPISVLHKSRVESPMQVDARERSGDGSDAVEYSTQPAELPEEESDLKTFPPDQIIESIVFIKEQKTREEDPTEETTREEEEEEAMKQEPRQTCEAECPDDPPVKDESEQVETCSGVETQELSEDGRGETEINKDFTAACYFLENHMNEVSDPNDDMRQALTVVFQQWFHISAEEDSCADTVSLYVNEVSKYTPAVLPFLVNMVDDNGNTALHYSVSHSNFRIAKILLDTGVCEVDKRNKIGYTAMMLACLVPVDSPVEMKAVQQLMKLSDVNARAGQVGQTALHLAVRHGRVSTVQLLLAQGANINAQDRAGTTALISACDRGHADIVRILLEDPDCDVNLTDKGGRSALSLATQASHTEIADLLRARAGTRGPDRCKMS